MKNILILLGCFSLLSCATQSQFEVSHLEYNAKTVSYKPRYESYIHHFVLAKDHTKVDVLKAWNEEIEMVGEFDNYWKPKWDRLAEFYKNKDIKTQRVRAFTLYSLQKNHSLMRIFNNFDHDVLITLRKLKTFYPYLNVDYNYFLIPLIPEGFATELGTVSNNLSHKKNKIEESIIFNAQFFSLLNINDSNEDYLRKHLIWQVVLLNILENSRPDNIDRLKEKVPFWLLVYSYGMADIITREIMPDTQLLSFDYDLVYPKRNQKRLDLKSCQKLWEQSGELCSNIYELSLSVIRELNKVYPDLNSKFVSARKYKLKMIDLISRI